MPTRLPSLRAPPELDSKLEELGQRIRRAGPMIVAASGGVDSTLVWAVARRELGDEMLAVTAASPSLSARERADVSTLTAEIGGRHIFVETSELDDPRYAANSRDRCYYCKVALWRELSEVARELGFSVMADGLNADDLTTHRPGHRAGEEFAVLSPLAEVGLSKANVRTAAKALGLSNWNKPAMACLASRFAYGEWIDEERLSRVEKAEQVLHRLGLGQHRVRVHADELVRIEIEPEEFGQLLEAREEIVAQLRTLGFVYVSLDIQGFRSGSMNEASGIG